MPRNNAKPSALKGSNIAIYNLNFTAMGGGERRSALLAAHLAKSNNVTLFIAAPLSPQLIMQVFGIDLSGVRIVPLQGRDHLREIAKSRPDVFINNSHSSELPNIAPAGIYMCMFPERQAINLESYDVITANSEYSAKWILKNWRYPSEVVYSACQDMGPVSKKEKKILNVARFFEDTPTAHHKRQDILVEAFRRFVDEVRQDWELHLVGRVNATAQDNSYLDRVRALSDRYPIRIRENISFDQLREEYRTASVYWHATGFGFAEEDRPSKQEHFGMSIVEALSAGAVPLAFNGGGPRETIKPGSNGYLWNSIDELIGQTQLLADDSVRIEAMSAQGVADSRHFSGDLYLARMDAIIKRLTSTGDVKAC